jgi:hypothetical protein
LDWALLEREKAPFGLTFVFTPQWRWLDDTSGAPQESFGFPIQLLATSRFRQTNGSPPPT